MKTKLIILGCGNSTGVPRIDGSWGSCKKNNKKNLRSRSSAFILKGSNAVLIDTSPDLKNQLINNNIKKISSVIYTHEHSDQTNGIFELRPFFWKNKEKINVYGNKKTINLLKKRFNYIFRKNYIYPPFAKANIVKDRFSLGNSNEKIRFKTLQVSHGLVKYVVYIFEKTAYIGDCNDLSIVKMAALKNLNYLIIDCLKIKKNYAHFNLKEALFVHSQLKPKKTILTNLSSSLDYEFLLKKLPNNVLPAYDGLILNL